MSNANKPAVVFAPDTWKGPASSPYSGPVKPAPKKGALALESFPSFSQWESAVAAQFGGVVGQWPAWAKEIYKRERGYLP